MDRRTQLPHMNPDSAIHTRPGDLPGIKITREIPLPWLLATFFAICAQIATSYFGQQEQSRLIVSLVSEMKELKASMQTKELKDMEQDMKYNVMLRDMSEMKAELKSRQLDANKKQ